ncbi:MAG: SIS domain-containing protein [Actinomycetota bacterium]|nr:SIS domain-containing protein [Actinomycetota bacterium]
MCGIIAIVRRPSLRTPPAARDVLAGLDASCTALGAGLQTLDDAAVALEQVDQALSGPPGVRALLEDPSLPKNVEKRLRDIEGHIADLERSLDSGEVDLGVSQTEAVNAALVRIKDAAWSLGRDRLRAPRAVAELAHPDPTADDTADDTADATAHDATEIGQAAVEAYYSLHSALSAIDRLEVRGRDSAGLHVLVQGHGLDLDSRENRAAIGDRSADPLFTSMAVRSPSGHLAFVYKAAAEIGELGDNTRRLRDAIAGDSLLRRALHSSEARATVLGHTRWASVGIISQPNAHPLNHEEEGRSGGPYVAAALNGDVDNHAELAAAEDLRIPAGITTDAKLVPTLVSRRIAGGLAPLDAFRHAVATLDGSVAIAASVASAPDQLLLALRGSGQALYVGLAEDAFVVASEPYGLVEETSRYLRMDGEAALEGVRGQVVTLDRQRAGQIEGITRLDYEGRPLPIGAGEIQTVEITSRDIDRDYFPHYLLKEITESPQSFRKTLRGKIDDSDSQLRVRLGEDTLPSRLRSRLRTSAIRRVKVIGQGTAAIAGQSLATTLSRLVSGTHLSVAAIPATELSGFGLDDDMSDTLVIAISQSGTTTDTNRTVDLARARGASVVAVVNRRNSDLAEKADGVLYTSDGRDVEMSVASTKAFYAQVAAGFLLALSIADEMGSCDRRSAHELLSVLRRLPEAMETVLTLRQEIGVAAQRYAPGRRHWAVVGNGRDRIAAQELRIKLSELCYKSIACDATEDKKHIDLSSEPLVLVCAAGLSGPNADDVAKEVAIYRSHKAAPVVITADADHRFSAAVHVIQVPKVDQAFAFVLAAMAGHLFAYEAALAIDAQALPFRAARAAVESLVSSSPDEGDPLERLAPLVEPAARRFFEELRTGSYDGHLEPSTAVRVASLLRYVVGPAPLDSYQVEFGKLGTPAVVVEDLAEALTRAVEELTRPVDAIKHQAKTVTVGISRSEEALFRVRLVEEVLSAGVARDRISYRALRTLAALDGGVADVTGFTRYRIEGGVDDGEATIHVVERGGVARDIPSRTSENPVLRGTKHRAAYEREVTVARGRNDGRTVVLVPETKGGEVTGMTLLHVRFHDRLPAADAQAVLLGYRDRYSALVDAVTETEPAFDEAVLGEVPLVDLLSEPVHILADHWRTAGS